MKYGRREVAVIDLFLTTGSALDAILLSAGKMVYQSAFLRAYVLINVINAEKYLLNASLNPGNATAERYP